LLHLRLVFERLRAANLHLKASKCNLFRSELHFLGHIVSGDGVRVDPAKVAAMREFRTPTDIHKLRRFLGMAGFYRRFVDGFGKIAKPLTDLTRAGVKFEWTQKCDDAFRELKDRLCSAPVLAYPDPGLPYVLSTDASGFGLGAVLAQERDGKECVVAYGSRAMTREETNYSATERECLAVVWAVQHFKHYLLGSKFTVRTDHQALRWLMSLREPTGRLARWALRLQEFEFEVVYRPGRAHSDVDALSREPLAIAALESDTTVPERQRADPRLAAVFAFLEQGTLPLDAEEARKLKADEGNFTIEDGRLYRVVQTLPGRRRQDAVQLRLAVPQEMVAEVLRACHDDALAGHLGVTKTVDNVMRRYWWPTVYKDTRNWVSSCGSCAQKKTARVAMAGRLQPIPVSRPWETVGVDILGPLHESARGNRYILVFSDYLTKWVEAFAVARADTPTVAQVLVDEVLCRHGAPERLLSDRGSVFRSALVREICAIFGVRKIFTTGYHPQTDGLVERFNGTLATMLSHYVDSNQDDWDVHLPAVLFAYRRTVQESIGDSPFYLTYGREAVAPADVAHGARLSMAGPTSAIEWRARLVSTLREAHELARASIQRAQNEQEAEYNSRTREVNFEPGDQVWLHSPHIKRGLSPKLAKLWTGPFRVERRVGHQTYELRDEQGRLHPGLVHVQRLKKATARPPELAAGASQEDTAPMASPDPRTPDEEGSEDATPDDGIYEVEAILGKRRRAGRAEYLVKWRGYPDSDNSWVPRDQFAIDNIVREYEKTLREARNRGQETGRF
jgi:transposase InsO family protein